MNTINTDLLLDVEKYAKENITDLQFHNLEHTQNVVNAVREIAKAENVDEDQIILLEIAAWFHDTGYTCSDCSNHEIKGVDIAKDYLKDKVSPEELDTISNCIMATRIPQTPRNLLEQIMCDADLSHLGTSSFEEYSEALRKERSEVAEQGQITESQWLVMNLHFLAEHRYFTNYAREHFQPKKVENINKIKSNMSALMDDASQEKEKKKDKKKKKEPKKPAEFKPRRDIETLHRVLARNQLGLSSIADRKASILLSINSIITSFTIGYLFRKIEELPQLLIPSTILAITGLVSVILAVLATRPNVSNNTKKKRDLNLLFFGDFVELNLNDYQSMLKDKTKDPQMIYDLMAKDSYYLGNVLDKKYRKVRLAFNFFMFGITVSVLSFIITFATL
ncbi:HD domain-containing protein [Flammeovirga yaeyamensis]|uniref:HD domain-containing protein n=1 Tax=Flammeovirga yaeyamensis TaxID=367791 RepID=A0AAX1NC40_9BACT|nr:Pycsar system effector family protein [Flammeovirga yaeyamensis]MBB3696982.1 putative metal-dependent HD superfamily phosphohydrolase [Flammeovirga yaeyamensis]NMF33645.1 HD domain-containing protein [Flammeovirga yaeyamensis]QWG05089.1 HD domain-containing protein [Flammeovirga yaeyamensis]